VHAINSTRSATVKRALPLIAAAMIAACLLSACGKSSKTVTETTANGQVTTQTVPRIHFAKTKFVLHTGLAFGAFHRYIYKPLRAGAFRSGATGRIRAFVKAAAAAAFIVHELKIAHEDALADDHLRPLARKVEALIASITGIRSHLKGSSVDTASLLGASSAIGSLGAASRGAGAAIKEIPVTVGA
jgi:hypothetical protein